MVFTFRLRFKNSAQGFAKYYALRHERLNDLVEGYVRFDIQHQPNEQGGKLILQVTDSGNGFDYSHHGHAPDTSNHH